MSITFKQEKAGEPGYHTQSSTEGVTEISQLLDRAGISNQLGNHPSTSRFSVIVEASELTKLSELIEAGETPALENLEVQLAPKQIGGGDHGRVLKTAGGGVGTP